ncbi:hypothetical protein [Thermodesulfatator autotrophicus]|uniref:Uncharacterized protein n=1 Tax=Thermodesulfatator autotrophicus TaxID=1795632 RepID=A0A177E616_9BACT|nr:hypothetical protein [Thermodesulfatator autotrophicus]OAG27335.1 hypothetical protein TH606_07635 [Thermodesulfatator autotrophicus]
MERVDRLAQIVEMAKQGKKVKAKVTLLKRPIVLKIHPEAQILEEKEAYILGAIFEFEVDGQTYKVERFYAMGFPTESFEEELANRNLANALLKEDYERLKEAGIEIEEKYFE